MAGQACAQALRLLLRVHLETKATADREAVRMCDASSCLSSEACMFCKMALAAAAPTSCCTTCCSLASRDCRRPPQAACEGLGAWRSSSATKLSSSAQLARTDVGSRESLSTEHTCRAKMKRQQPEAWHGIHTPQLVSQDPDLHFSAHAAFFACLSCA